MAIRLSLNEETNWFVPGSPDNPALLHGDPSDRVWVCPSALGRGYRQEIPLQEDLSLWVLDYTLEQDVIIDGIEDRDCLEFEFQLSGSQAGYSFFLPYFGFNSLYIKPAGQRFFKVELFFRQPTLNAYFQACLDHLSSRSQKVAEQLLQAIYQLQTNVSTIGHKRHLYPRATQGDRCLPVRLEEVLQDSLYTDAMVLDYAAQAPITAAMQETLGHILSCPYHGANRRRYLQEQAFTLVSLYLQAIAAYARLEKQFDYIHESAAILRKELSNPPSIEALARQVGTNRLKLNQGFHQMYGTTPFRYLRDCRVRQARKLLMTTELSVSDVACQVGYGSPSRFTTAFRQQFGLNPKAFQLQAWQLAS
ncbi:helix-turn-helix domain-containing protein (plasmid) [Picosynechococcus sp. PCC 11901]|uniref:helix-turn-helix transcriptional regulator n=1 Tax=Picosynechococcus sp. PCC 11901 TaxID=2579791 RepID=UPI0010FC159F|nr:AraC family transcriptional regulator [Picosynechococcus sp. PCC 11901]QCS51088.1 helix-turn-helix domain-containing protein [Picosynechococcus sp. PCC 11901]